MDCVRIINDYERKEIAKTYKNITIIDGNKCGTVEDYFQIVYDTFNFPKYNMLSFDAYSDWMRDDYFETDPIVIVITNEQAFLKNDQKSKKIIIDIFNEDIIPYWEKILLEKKGKKKARKFLVYLVKSENDN